MLNKRPDPSDEYEDWEFPDPRDVEDLAGRRFDDEASSPKKSGIPILKLGGALMVLAFIVSTLLPLLGLLDGSGDPGETNTVLEDQAYQQWIANSVNASLSKYGGAGQVQYMGTQFGDSVEDPIVGIESDGIDLQNESGMGILQSYSKAVLEDLFADNRAQRVTVVWFETAFDNASGELTQEVVLMVGILRQTAQSIDWAGIGPADLRYIADYYQERPSKGQEQL
jgi:hypothetical protein